ncbi:hypothetical protein [Mycolicibacterium baixiangningiae]|uniref:hypothetical protein n=1 Tax=Mycolicibacterium baixiangningiae TaxID=2761578 RepID=UPI001D01B501|nr:hypothetical protein [Mycolicibacterium baixiangningiae]
MADNTMSQSIKLIAITPDRRSKVPHTSLWAMCTALLRAGRLDAQLAVGTAAAPGTALAVRATRLTTRRNREALARTLCRSVHDARDRTLFSDPRLPLNRANILSAEPVIDDIVARLRAPEPVHARGVARLNRVLADGTGPLYRFGRGDLVGRLGASHAAM